MTPRTIGTAQILTGTAAALAMLYFLRGIMIPFVIAFVLAVLVNALVRFIQNRWAKAPPWAVAALAGLVVIICAAGSIFVLAQGMVQIVGEGPALLTRVDQIAVDVGRSLHLHEDLHLGTIVGKVSVPEIAGSIASGGRASSRTPGVSIRPDIADGPGPSGSSRASATPSRPTSGTR